ncbi:MAG TPA: hypothetical protein PKJ63_00465 [Cyclobacteriaceae bacterium]|nr:hypothetical protein [Cyclobacteriaceae bacterium]
MKDTPKIHIQPIENSFCKLMSGGLQFDNRAYRGTPLRCNVQVVGEVGTAANAK